MPVTVITTDRGELPAIAVNVGLGGMSLETETPLTFNSEVKVRVRLPTLDEDSVIEGTVRWVNAGGSGVQFGSLRARDVWAINQLLRTVA